MTTKVILTLLLLYGIFSARADWLVDASALAAHGGGASSQSFATRAEAEAFINRYPGNGLRLVSGGFDRQAAAPSQNNNEATQAAAAAAKKAQEEAARQQAEAQAAAEKAVRDAEQARQFQKAKAAALSQMKGVDFDNSGGGNGLKGLDDTQRKGNAVTANSGLKDALNDNGWGLKGIDPQPTHFVITDSMVVDARNVPTGLPKSIEDSIPNTPAGNRVRKGFQAVLNHDWPVALAWFQDALNKKPGDAGLQRLVDLARFTLNYRNHPPVPAAAAPAAQLQTITVPASLDVLLKEKLNDDLAKAMDDYNNHYIPPSPKSNEHIMTDEEFFKMEDPAWIQFFRFITSLIQPYHPPPPPGKTEGGTRG